MKQIAIIALVALCGLLIGPPAVLMGGTIPILTLALAGDLQRSTRIHAWIYGINTLGAFAGALASAYFLIPALGRLVLGNLLLVQGQAYRQQYDMNVIHLLPVNLYGPGDNFDPHSSHVIPALIRRLDEAIRTDMKSLVNWGSGDVSREFLFVDDAAEGIVAATISYDGAEPVNLGSGREITIRKLYQTLRGLMGYTGRARWDKTKPDGQPRRSLDTSRARELFGWEARTSFQEGLKATIDWFQENIASAA